MPRKTNSIQSNDTRSYFFADLVYFLTFSVSPLRTSSKVFRKKTEKSLIFRRLEYEKLLAGGGTSRA